MPAVYSAPFATDAHAAAAGRRMVRANVEALLPGTWPADPEPITLSAQDVAAIAAAYDPSVYLAPVVIGHPQTEDPAWGWVSAATFRDGALWLQVDLLPEMADLVREGRYRSVSVSLWTPEAPGNPSPGVWALKHLGYLGAVPPAVKGLAPTRFDANAAGGGTITVARPGKPRLRPTVETMTMSDATPDAQLAERERRLAERESALAAREAQLRRAAYEQELSAHVAAGRLLPAETPALVALMQRLETADAITLAEGERPAIDVLRRFIAGLPARVSLGESAAPPSAQEQIPAPAVPHGWRLSERGLALHARAVQWQAAHPGADYLTAVRAVERIVQ